MPDHFTLLLEWRRNEAAARGLAKLPHDFYPATSAYLAEVRRSYESELRENPSGRKGEISRQTYQRASQVARDVVEGRVQKTISAAFQASIGGARDLPNALPEERTMFDELLDALLKHRRTAAAYLEPIAVAATIPPSGVGSAPSPAAPPASAPPPTATAASPVPRTPGPLTYVRILKDGRPIEVGKETIDLRADDVLSVPADTAKLLVDAKMAELIAPGPARTVT
jgi:DNA replication initiation complex subunit (GINS family)